MSSYTSIMVGLDLGPDVTARVKLAADFADRFGAHLIGVAARRPVVTVVADTPYTVGAIIEQEQEYASGELGDAEAAFRKAVGSNNRIEVRSAVGIPGAVLVQHARAADIIVVGRQGPDDHQDRRFSVDPGDVVLQAGRPVLVAPPAMDHLTARRIVVGWKDTREARRAVQDALPLLKTAEEVFIVAIGDESGPSAVLDVREHLHRHGVRARTVAHASGHATVADELIAATEREGADLIVCGAYGHSRTREWVFGGVTRELLDYSPVACLMAH